MSSNQTIYFTGLEFYNAIMNGLFDDDRDTVSREEYEKIAEILGVEEYKYYNMKLNYNHDLVRCLIWFLVAE